ncbi:MAG TPA: metal-binding protein [Pyrinomonadaceae bacterium]
MPSGRTHDLITFVLAPPTFLAVWVATGSLKLAAVVTCATLFGGLMFGPDLDIQSRQYTRWGVFRFLWLPYKVAFRHRSRLSHGIILGTLIRVLYFTGAVAALTLLAVYLHARFVAGDAMPGVTELVSAWHAVAARATALGAGRDVLLAAFGGLWWGAAIHTFADVMWSILRKSTEIF